MRRPSSSASGASGADRRPRSGPVGVDTAIFIHYIEENSRFLPLVAPIFTAADAGRLELVVSALTLLEVLVIPYRVGNLALARRYEILLTRSRGIRMVDLTQAHFRMAAQLRAATNAATPDAIQLATALSSGCSAYLTNDRRLPTVPGLKIAQLGSYAV